MSMNRDEAVPRERTQNPTEGMRRRFGIDPQFAGNTARTPNADQVEIDDAREALAEAILDTARWRREKATEFPNDGRNRSAAELLERIAATVSDVPAGLMQQYAEAWHGEAAFRISEAQFTSLRHVGFSGADDNATGLVEHLLRQVADAPADL